MLILSTFNSEYLQNPALKYPHIPLLKSLFEKFTTEPINIKYVNKNLIGELLNLNIKTSQSYAILFRTFDFLEADSIIDEYKLTSHLNIIVKQISVFKQENQLPFIVFLCPSPKKVLNTKLKNIEKLFIEKLNENKIHTLTLSNIKENYRVEKIENPIEEETHIPYTPEFYTAIACLLTRKFHAIKQKPFKLIAVDCDNTLWTGVAADDGIEGIVFKEHNILLQNYLVEQQAQGKIICLCSKNDEQTVLDVFKHHEAIMPLKLKHLSNNKINRESKSNNIKKLVLELNIFPDSVRFIDDNPTEVYDVSQIPGIFCITMPQNLEAYKHHWAFDFDEHSIITETDKNRTEFYEKAEIKAALATKFNDPVEYLRSPELGQSITISKIDSKEDIKTIQRVSQLSGKTNQFNMFPEPTAKEISEIKAILNSTEREIFLGKIKDNFSLEDITAVAMCSLGRNSLTIDGFFVSCRVFRRGMEYEMLKHIAHFSQARGLKNIKLKFKKSEKNNSVCGFLNILSEETNKYPISRFLLNESKNYPGIHDNLKFLFKKLNLCVDFNSFSLNEETVLTLSARKLINLNLDALIIASLNVSQQTTKQHPNKSTMVTNEIDEKYLIELKQMTISPKYLLNKFFIDKNIIDSIADLEIRVNILCNRLLGGEGQNKSLIARGLDSLKATELRFCLFEVEKIIITIPLLLCEKTTNLTLIDYIKEQKRSKKNDYRLEQSKETIILNDNFYNQTFPVSLQEQRIFRAEQSEGITDSAGFHMIACFCANKLDINRLKGAYQILIQCYDIFGYYFSIKNGQLMKSYVPPKNRKINFFHEEIYNKFELMTIIRQKTNEPLSMVDSKELIRLFIFEDKINQKYNIFFHVHHAIFDAVSLKNCLYILSKIYQDNIFSNLSSLKNYPPQYIDFIHYQQKKLEDKAYQTEAYNFWKKTLHKVKQVTKLDKSISTPATEQAANRYVFSLFSEDVLKLKNLAQLNYVTCFSVLNAVFALLVSVYTFEKNITLITATNGRDGHPTFDKMIGFFVNLLVQTFDLEENQPFDEYLKQVNKKFLVSQKFQHISFDKIQEILFQQNVKGILLSPAFIYQSYAIPKLKLEEETAELVLPEKPIIFDIRKTCRFGNFTIFAQENKQELNFIIEYAQDLFSLPDIERFAKNFMHTIKNVCNNPKQKFQEISFVCDKERRELIKLSDGLQLNYLENDNLARKLKNSFEKHSNNLAFVCGEICSNYQEVNQQSTNLAQVLINIGVQQGQHVGIYLEPNHLFYIAIIAALKIGAVFIPLSKEDPYDRLKSIIEDAEINFFIVDEKTKGLFDTDFQACPLISIHSIKNQYLTDDLPLLTTTMEDNACILYTSGSTGKPKGVILPHKAIFRVMASLSDMVKPQDIIAQTANQVFDAAQLEFFLAFLNGASLIILDKNILLNEKLFTKELSNKNISVMWLTAGLFNLYGLKSPEIFMKLKFLMSGGDVVDKKAVEQVLSFNPNLQFMNGYGPTETGIFALTYMANKENLSKFPSVPIGSPIAGTQTFILNAFNTLAPLGAIGQLGIAGDGLGTYHNNENLNKKSFLPFPEKLKPESPLDRRNERSSRSIYMSGDKVQYRNNEILFLDRINDKQIKIRGNLVSLIEIKNALEQHPAIVQAEIIYKQISSKNRILAVFYTKNEACLNPRKQELIQFLSTKLPQTMIPVCYEKIPQFRLTANGKLDRADLSKLPLTTLEENDSDQENTPENLKIFQNKLSSIFKDILSFPTGLDSNFFDIGGDSIAAIQLLAKVEEDFGIRMSFNTLRQNSTIRSLSYVLERGQVQEKDLLSLLHKGKDEQLPPIIFIHPAGGGLFCFKKLIEALKQLNLSNYCYGIEDPVIIEREVKTLTIPQMATNYLKYIREKIKGSFILAGYSFGGMVALEIAAQLEMQALNQNSLGVVLLDTWVVSCADEKLKETLRSHVLEYCEEVIQNVSANPKIETVENLIIPMMEQCKYYQLIGFEFRPYKLFSTPVSLFKAKDIDKFEGMEEKTQCNYLENFIESKNLIKHMVEGNHFTLLEEGVNLVLLAKNLVNYIEKICQQVPNMNMRPFTFFPTASEQDVIQKNTLLAKQISAPKN